ncbi:MAG TPA: SRPBCC family protein [Phycisphaerae bacterium]|nr:SRPBCC family protein [Phycisphaerae bacterium]
MSNTPDTAHNGNPSASNEQPREVRRPDIARPPHDDEPSRNVGMQERIVSGAAGALLLLVGLKRGGLLTRLSLLSLGGALLYRSATGYCSLYDKLGINTAHDRPASPEDYFQHGVHVEKSYLIARPAPELYNFWRNVENLPRFMQHLEKVEELSATRSRWTAKAPFGRHASWEAEIIHDVPNQLIAWKSMENSTLANAGTVTFTPVREGHTEVKVVLDYIPPAGALGHLITQLFGEEPSQTVEEELRRFKHLMEHETPAGQGAQQAPKP